MTGFPRRAAVLAACACVAAAASGCGDTTVSGNARPDGSTPTTSAAPTTTAPATTTVAPPVDPSRYAGSVAGSWYFTTPTQKFQCGILTGGTQSVAGCQGDLPKDAPRVEGSGAPGTAVAPNTVEVESGSAGRFVSSGDPKFYDFDRSTLDLAYGAPLIAGGFTCAVDELSGVSCMDSTEHGFTVSSDGYRLF